MYCFYISLGIDAYILNHILNLKLTDRSNTKRVGIPINSIYKKD
jgi:DNA mismatch repair ATPase MutS